MPTRYLSQKQALENKTQFCAIGAAFVWVWKRKGHTELEENLTTNKEHLIRKNNNNRERKKTLAWWSSVKPHSFLWYNHKMSGQTQPHMVRKSLALSYIPLLHSQTLWARRSSLAWSRIFAIWHREAGGWTVTCLLVIVILQLHTWSLASTPKQRKATTTNVRVIFTSQVSH